MKTKDEILLELANENSYDTWVELIYDCNSQSQIEYTGQAMQQFSDQNTQSLIKSLGSLIAYGNFKSAIAVKKLYEAKELLSRYNNNKKEGE